MRAAAARLGRALRVLALVVCYLLVGWFLGFAALHALHLLRNDDG